MELKDKKVNFLGDSITEGAGASGPEHFFVTVFGKKTGSVARNYGIGGTRIARKKAASANARWDLCFLDRVEQMDPDADIVVIFGGTNDFGHGDAPLGTLSDTDEYTFCGAMKSLLERVINRYPDAAVVVMTPMHRLSEASNVNEIGLPTAPLSEFVRMEKEIAALYSVPVLDLWGVSGIQPCIPVMKERYTADGLHPNDRGAERVADRLIGFLKTL